MKLETAIGFLTFLDKSTTFYFTVDDHSAIKLGIEALKAIHEHRSVNFPWATPKLPGETKE